MVSACGSQSQHEATSLSNAGERQSPTSSNVPSGPERTTSTAWGIEPTGHTRHDSDIPNSSELRTTTLQTATLDYDTLIHEPAARGRPSSHGMGKAVKLTEQRDIIMAELGRIVETRPDYVFTLYRNLVSETDFAICQAAFMKDGRWEGIPSVITSEHQLYAPGVKLINNFLKTILVDCDARKGLMRKAVKTHNVQVKHKEAGLYSLPDIVIRALGSSFEGAYGTSTVIWANVASVFDAKPQSRMGDMTAHLRQLAIYARQIFLSQPNRIFVRCLLFSESHARLVHFDRSGCEYSPSFNIHENPLTFLRLVIGLSSTDERDLGFDTSIMWKVSKGFKKSGTITVHGRDGKAMKYELARTAPFFQRDSVLGRGTRCYYAIDPRDANKRVVIKDLWCSQNRRHEHTFLEKAQGLQGVCQLVDFDTALYKSSTRDFRCTSSVGNVHHRIHSRIVLEACGLTIEHFRSPVEAIGAIRDAIAAHESLFSRRILHRDISSSNIFLGDPYAKGQRGILSDFDMAIEFGPSHSEECLDRSGTRFFQSLAVLDSYWKEPSPPAQDYLDDLQSFLYLLCFLVLLFSGRGEWKRADDPGHALVEDWTDNSAKNNRRAKYSFLAEDDVLDQIVQNIDDEWDDPARRLLSEFRDFIAEIVKKKGALVRQSAPRPTDESGNPLHRFASLHKDVCAHYQHVLGIFDEAIDKYSDVAAGSGRKTQGETGVISSSTEGNRPVGQSIPASRASRSNLDVLAKKRRPEGEHPASPKPKRLATAPVQYVTSSLREGGVDHVL